MQLKTVVLPAPFGPISAVISPRRTSNETSSTAVRPPKRMVKWSIVSSGSEFINAIRRPSAVAFFDQRRGNAAALPKRNRRRTRRDKAAWAPVHHHDHGDTYDQHAVLGRIEVLTKNSLQKIKLAQNLRATDDDGGGERDDGENRRALDEGEARWRDESLAHCKESAGKAAEHRAKREGGEFQFHRIETERAAGNLVFAQSLPGAADRQPPQPHGDEIGQQSEAEDQIREKDHAMNRRKFEAECRGETVRPGREWQ